MIWEDGTIRRIEGFGRFYYNSEGQAMRMAGLIRDITEQQAALTRTPAGWSRTAPQWGIQSRILEHNNDCIKVLDLDGRLLYMK